ncbi:unnamed protein product (macronuclear) [Paramecium tetraurelia]|uniref:Cyclic nucleotide-binding domain-containing protein n=1 Tax=Paramecium tetraurelia TaxID=5888 RepID=A0CHY7_PARTE|nr:uncharacterized protein GSPATT00038506001 [Paramecium tetraurelia]CAK70404.1 unnamed protein product [Paramecium tetraurelia]|eukprot:XP_001437801.1 hypothetical protein (macronuclear) [Paramecium tetraurelia strain d4-2]
MNISQQYEEQQNSERIDTQFRKQDQNLFRRQFSQYQFNNTWKLNGLNIILIVLKFIQAITKQTFTTSFKLLNRQFFKLLKDKTSDYNYYLHRGYFTQAKAQSFMIKFDQRVNFFQYYRRNYIKRFMQFILLEPDDTIIIIWNIYLLCIVTINVFYVSLRLSFVEIVKMDWVLKDFIFEQLPSYSFLLEIIIKFNTCIYSKGVLIKNRKRLIKRYLKREFLIDMVLIIPFFIGRQFDFIYLDLVIILKVFQISKLTNSLFNRLELTQQQTTVFELVKLIFFILLCAHFSACIWHKLGVWGDWGDKNTLTWLIKEQLYNSMWIDRYVVSFYWSIVTMTTIGYGDITPVNLTERLFCIGMTLISTATFAYSVNSIGQIFQDMSKQSVQFKTNMNSLNRYLKNQKVSTTLQIKFRRYFEYFWSKPSQEVIQFQDQIPQQLKDLMIVDINIKLLKQLDLFKQFTNSLLNILCLQFKEQQLQPDEYLFKSNQRADKLYILVSGQIDLHVIINKKKRIIEKIKTQCLVGQLNFLLNTEYNYEAIATKNTKLLAIDRQTLIENIKQSDIDYQIYKNFEEDIRLQKQFGRISIKCSICHKSNHFVLDCPLLIGGINRTKVLYQLRHNVPQDRILKVRNNEDRRISTKKHHFLVMESVIQYIMKNDEICNLEGIKESAIKQQQQYEEKISYNLSNQFTKPTSQLPNVPTSINCISHQSLRNTQQIQNQRSLKDNQIQEVPIEKDIQFGTLSKSQDIRLLTDLNNLTIQPILEEPQTKEERSDENKFSINLSEQLPQVEIQQTSIVPSADTDTKQPQQRMMKKRHSIRQKFERKQTEQYENKSNRQKQFKRLFTERQNSQEGLPQLSGFNNQLIVSQQQKMNKLQQPTIMRKQSIQDYIIQKEKAQEPLKHKQNKQDDSPFELEYSNSQRSIKNSNVRPNIEIFKVDDDSDQSQDKDKKQITNKIYTKVINDDENSEDEKDLTNQFLEEQILKNRQRFTDKQIASQEPQQNQLWHFPQQEFKPLEQSMMIQYEKIKQKEELLHQQKEKQQTVINNKESKESKDINNQASIQRGLTIKVTSDDSSDEDINGQKLIRGQYLEIFKDFEVVKEFKCYYPHNNINQIIFLLYKNDFNSQHHFLRKRKIKKQDTIMNLLKQTQNLIRKNQQ